MSEREFDALPDSGAAPEVSPPVRYEVPAHLPPYGPQALAFSPTLSLPHGEEFVVRFWDMRGESWVGNFRCGAGYRSGVVAFPQDRSLLVFACGNLYLVDPDARRCVEALSAGAQEWFEVPELNQVVVQGTPSFEGWDAAVWFVAYGPSGRLWKSGPLENVCDVQIRALTLSGTSENGWGEYDHHFEIDLRTGEFTRGRPFGDYPSHYWR